MLHFSTLTKLYHYLLFFLAYSDFVVIQVQDVDEGLQVRTSITFGLNELEDAGPRSHQGQNGVFGDLKNNNTIRTGCILGNCTDLGTKTSSMTEWRFRRSAAQISCDEDESCSGKLHGIWNNDISQWALLNRITVDGIISLMGWNNTRFARSKLPFYTLWMYLVYLLIVIIWLM
jgi:hypothetical protein